MITAILINLYFWAGLNTGTNGNIFNGQRSTISVTENLRKLFLFLKEPLFNVVDKNHLYRL